MDTKSKQELYGLIEFSVNTLIDWILDKPPTQRTEQDRATLAWLNSERNIVQDLADEA